MDGLRAGWASTLGLFDMLGGDARPGLPLWRGRIDGMTDGLVAFLRARLDEDERIARTAINPKHRGDWAWRKDSRSTVRERDGVPIGPEAQGVEIGPHIARWNPARVLREVEAKRQIIEWCERANRVVSADDYEMDVTTPLELLASPYADHPDYRQEWKP